MKQRSVRPVAAALAVGAVMAFAPVASFAGNQNNPGNDDQGNNDQSRIQRGYQINPVPLNLKGKNRALVGLGSYIVNSNGCNDCHTHPSYAPGHDPFLGQPEQINADQYLTGGRQFGPFTSANLTPDALGRPAGLTLEEFITWSGGLPAGASGSWPVIGKKTDRDLHAIYEYLRAIPSRPDNPNPGP